MPCQRLRTLQDEVTEGREEEVGRERQRGRMHSSRVSLFIVATCFAIVPGGRRFLARTSPIVLLLHGRQTCAPAGLLRPSARMRSTISFIHLRSESLPLIRALSAPVSACFSFCFFYKYKSSTFFAVWLRPLNATRFVRSFVHFSLTPSKKKKKKDGFASASHVANAVPFCLTGAQSVPEHVWCQWRNAGPFISGITLSG